jgi:hypothetical protein
MQNSTVYYVLCNWIRLINKSDNVPTIWFHGELIVGSLIAIKALE